MPKIVTTARARALWSDGVPFIDVLPPASFAREHLVDAVNVPLADIAGVAEQFERTQPVVVYCYDHQ